MKNKIFKSLLLVFLLTVTLVPPHVHDDKCGYDPKTGTGCVYEVVPFDDRKPGN